MTSVDAMLEQLRPHLERLFRDDDLTGFELVGKLREATGLWEVSRRASFNPEVMRKMGDTRGARRRARELTAAN